MTKPEITSGPRCIVCAKLLSGLKGSAKTCSERCGKKKSRIAQKRSARAVDAFEAYAMECTAEAVIGVPERNGEAGGNV